MDRSRRNSTGVLGPLGLLLVAVLWLMTISGNTASKNVVAPTPPEEPGYVDDGVVRAPAPTHGILTSHPTSLPTTGTGA
jgi:hypothetical protein